MFKLRQGGTSNFVSKIDTEDRSCYPPGRVDFVSGWEAECLELTTQEEAKKAVDLVEEIEGIRCYVEPAENPR